MVSRMPYFSLDFIPRSVRSLLKDFRNGGRIAGEDGEREREAQAAGTIVAEMEGRDGHRDVLDKG